MNTHNDDPGVGGSFREGNGNTIQYFAWRILRAEELTGLQSIRITKNLTRWRSHTRANFK